MSTYRMTAKQIHILLALLISTIGFFFATKTLLAQVSLTSAATPGIAAGGGIQYLNATDLNTYLDGLANVHSKWVRFDFAWSDIQAVNSATYSWSKYDAVVAAANARDIEVLGMIGYTPSWARPGGCTNDKCRPNNPAQFATFVGQVVNRYKTQGVKYWEIWNEPNISPFWQPAPNVAQYTTLLQQAYQAAKAADSGSFIVSAGTSPAASDGTNISPTDFLAGIYTNGGKAYFDAVGHHPYCYAGTFDCPNTYAAWSAWSQMSETPTSLRSIMAANGDTSKKIWVTEFGAPTNGTDSVSNAQQATMLSDAYDTLSSKSWAGPLFWYSYQDAGTNVSDREDWFGMRSFSGAQKPAYSAYAALYVPPTPSPSPSPSPSPTPGSPSPSPATGTNDGTSNVTDSTEQSAGTTKSKLKKNSDDKTVNNSSDEKYDQSDTSNQLPAEATAAFREIGKKDEYAVAKFMIGSGGVILLGAGIVSRKWILARFKR